MIIIITQQKSTVIIRETGNISKSFRKASEQRIWKA